MELDIQSKEVLIKKYKLAGKIRFISFSLLFCYLVLMKTLGGYSYLNPLFMLLFFVEAIINQPYSFLVHKVNIRRFQYYQMATDIIAISWVLYYMGGIDAPIVSIAYYAVILWAGVVSTQGAVLFAVLASALSFSLIVIFEQAGFLPAVSFYDYKMPLPKVASLVITNVSFLFAFGYFSVQSSKIVQLLQKKRQEESLKNTHKLLAAGHLLSSTAQDMLNYLFSIKYSAEILRDMPDLNPEEKKKILEGIITQGEKSSNMLTRLAMFSKKTEEEFEPADIHEIIKDALELTSPLTKYSNIRIDREFAADIPRVVVNKKQIQEVFAILILNALDAIVGQSKLLIKTDYLKKIGDIKIIFSDAGKGIKTEHLKHIGELFFTTKKLEEGAGLGLATAYGIIARHNGKINVESALGKGTTFTIYLPITQPEK